MWSRCCLRITELSENHLELSLQCAHRFPCGAVNWDTSRQNKILWQVRLLLPRIIGFPLQRPRAKTRAAVEQLLGLSLYRAREEIQLNRNQQEGKEIYYVCIRYIQHIFIPVHIKLCSKTAKPMGMKYIYQLLKELSWKHFSTER